jgi:hypothetical protein
MSPPDAAVGPIQRFMAEDHARIDRWLALCEKSDGWVDFETYARFRHDLLRHIGMEEKVLLPYARAKRGREPLPFAALLRAEHGEIAKLLVRSPTTSIIAALRELLGRHNPREEGRCGLYAACDDLAGNEAAAIVQRLQAQPDVPLANYYDGPRHGPR